MSTSSVPNLVTTTVSASSAPASTMEASTLRQAILGRISDYSILTKPRIAVLVLLTVTAGFTLASAERWNSQLLMHALFGITLVAGASASLNQFVERHSDGRMRRTANRPLPAGRLSPTEVLLFGIIVGGTGVLYLAVFVNLLTSALALLTLLLYAAVYTPLKRSSTLSTAVGAIPGALPPVLGWAAANDSLGVGAFGLFGILFLWQFPHFLAIGWIYRDDYARAGLKMLPLDGKAPRVVGVLTVGYSLALLPLSLHPSLCGLAGAGYGVVAVILGLGYVAASLRFAFAESTHTARGLLWASLAYLPLLLSYLVWDHWRLLS